MPITVNCPCKKSLRVKDDFAGKRIKCTGCGKVLQVPEPDAVGEDDRTFGLAAPSDKTCPECKAILPKGEVICEECGFNYRTGAKSAARMPAEKPSDDAAEELLRSLCRECGSAHEEGEDTCSHCGAVLASDGDERELPRKRAAAKGKRRGDEDEPADNEPRRKRGKAKKIDEDGEVDESPRKRSREKVEEKLDPEAISAETRGELSYYFIGILFTFFATAATAYVACTPIGLAIGALGTMIFDMPLIVLPIMLAWGLPWGWWMQGGVTAALRRAKVAPNDATRRAWRWVVAAIFLGVFGSMPLVGLVVKLSAPEVALKQPERKDGKK